MFALKANSWTLTVKWYDVLYCLKKKRMKMSSLPKFFCYTLFFFDPCSLFLVCFFFCETCPFIFCHSKHISGRLFDPVLKWALQLHSLWNGWALLPTPPPLITVLSSVALLWGWRILCILNCKFSVACLNTDPPHTHPYKCSCYVLCAPLADTSGSFLVFSSK